MIDPIAVIGLGHAGLPLACQIASCGFEVIGVDVNKQRCEQINNGVNPFPEEPLIGEIIKQYGGMELFATTQYENAAGCTTYIIIVPLLLDALKKPDYEIIDSATRSIARILKRGDLVVVETTDSTKT